MLPDPQAIPRSPLSPGGIWPQEAEAGFVRHLDIFRHPSRSTVLQVLVVKGLNLSKDRGFIFAELKANP